MKLLEVDDLQVTVDGKQILDGLSLTVKSGDATIGSAVR